MKKIVIVGGSAALSNYLLPELSREHQVFTMGRQNCDLYGDLTDDLNSFELPSGTDVIIHIAASHNYQTTDDIITMEETNALGTLKMCMVASQRKVKHFILISSIYAGLSKESLYYGFYSLSKKHSEELAAHYCSLKHMPLTILRPSQLYDDHGEYRKHQPLLYHIADCAEDGKDIYIYGTNDAARNYIHVVDLARIITLTVNKNITGEYTCAHPKNTKLSEMAHAAYQAFNKQGQIKFNEEMADIPDNIFPQDSALYEKLSFHPEIDIFTGMQKISDYRRKKE